jgi:hypothetical protein
MSSNTFKAQVALSSWVGSPLIPDLKVLTEIISTVMKCQNTADGKGKGKAKDNSTTILVESDA